MEFFKLKENIRDPELMDIIPGSDLDNLIKETEKEVAPLKVGVCGLTYNEGMVRMDREFNLVSSTDRFVANYFRDKPEYPTYIQQLATRALRTRMLEDGTISIDKLTQKGFDVVPVSDIEEILSGDYPGCFYRFVMGQMPDDRSNHIFGLFLYDEKNVKHVHYSDILSRTPRLISIFGTGKDCEEYRFLADINRTLMIGPQALTSLHKNALLV
jgi:hypothetical protein